MGIKEAIIYLDNQFNTYYAGQTINGRIEYVFDSPKKVRGIHVKFKGEAHTEWRESKEQQTSDGKTENTDEVHTGNEEVILHKFASGYDEPEDPNVAATNQLKILGDTSQGMCDISQRHPLTDITKNQQDHGNEIEVPAGKQVYSFTCALPPVLPSSFEGEFGYVRYTVKVTLDRPWKFDQETKMAFTVINALDLNLNPSYREPIRMQMEKTFCCFCCASPPLSVDIQAPVSGYCPGQVIPVSVDIENKSNVQLHLVKVFLRKVVTYRATSPSTATKKCKEVVLTVQEGPAPAGATKHYDIRLEVPPTPPSNLVNCSIIDLDYDLKVECVVSGMHMNLKDRKYVTIGTVPLMGLTGQPAPSAPEPLSPSQPAVLPLGPGEIAQPNGPPGDGPGGWQVPGSGPAPSAPYQSLYPTLSVPVYKESTYTARTIQDRGDNNYTQIAGRSSFAPYYPTYAAVQPPPLPQ